MSAERRLLPHGSVKYVKQANGGLGLGGKTLEGLAVSAETAAHLIRGIAKWDPFTGESLPVALSKVLQSLHEVLGEGGRPLPLDRLQQAADLVRGPLKEVLAGPRTRIERRHVMLPLHRAREMDAQCIDWLGRQPGRTVREKLAQSPRVKAVLREASVDTIENRLVAKLMRVLSPLLRTRIEAINLGEYTVTRQSVQRKEVLSEVLQLCDRGLSGGSFGAIDCSKPIQANNVLLGDRRYSKLWRAWRWIRQIDAEAEHCKALLVDNTATSLFWSLVALLAGKPGVTICDAIADLDPGWARETGAATGVCIRPRDYRGADDDVQAEIVLCAAITNAAGKVATQRFGTRIRLQGRVITVQTQGLEGNLVYRASGPPLASLRYDVVGGLCGVADPTGDQQRSLDLLADGHSKSGVDVSGFAALAHELAAAVPWCAVTDEVQQNKSDTGIEIGSQRTKHLGLDVCSVIPTAVAGGHAVKLDARLHAARYPSQRVGNAVGWLPGRAQSSYDLVAKQALTRDIRDAITMYDEEQPELVKQAIDCFIGNLADECRSNCAGMPPSVAYTVPDATDEFSQEALRIGLQKHFPHSSPIWRSAAIALGWQASDSFRRHPIQKGHAVLVLDASADALTVTLLKACHDEVLKKRLPESRGIYWERHPSVSEAELPLETAELARKLASSNLFADYQKALIDAAVKDGKAKGSEGLAEAMQRLSRTGLLEQSLGDVRPGLWPLSVRGDIGGIATLYSPHAWAAAARVYGERLAAFLRQLQKTNVIETLRQESRMNAGGLTVLALGTPFCLAQMPTRVKEAVEKACGEWRCETAESSRDVAAEGASDYGHRVEEGLPSFRDYLPHLYLEVIRDGYFHLLELLAPKDASKLNISGTTQFMVEEKLSIPPGASKVRFPLFVGRRMERLGQDAVIEDPHSSVKSQEPGSLLLKYTYGAASPYGLEFIADSGGRDLPLQVHWQPAPKPEAKVVGFYTPEVWSSPALEEPLRRLVGAWEEVQQHIAGFLQGAATSHDYLVDLAARRVRSWNSKGHASGRGSLWQEPRSVGDATEVFAEWLRRAFEWPLRVLWDQGRVIAQAPNEIKDAVADHVADVFGSLADLPVRQSYASFAGYTPQESAPITAMSAILLSRLHMDAPESLVHALLDAIELRSWQLHGRDGIHSLLGFVAGDCRGIRRSVIETLGHHTIDELRQDERGTVSALCGLSRALWRHTDAVYQLADSVPEFVDNYVSNVDQLFLRIAQGKVGDRYSVPFAYVAGIEALLALLRLRTHEQYQRPLAAGSKILNRVARAILQADERLTKAGVAFKPTLTLEVSVPRECSRVSPLAYMARSCLTGDRGDPLMHIAGVQTSD